MFISGKKLPKQILLKRAYYRNDPRDLDHAKISI